MTKKISFSKNCDGSGGRTVWPKRLSFSQFVILISTTNCEKDSLLEQTVLPPEPIFFLEKEVFLAHPLSFRDTGSVDSMCSRNYLVEIIDSVDSMCSRNYLVEILGCLLYTSPRPRDS